MPEYIAKEHALRKLGELSREPAYQHDDKDYYVGICDASCVINEIKATDVAPVRHGRWLNNDIPDSILSKCSECGILYGVSSFTFCPNCGAKMDGAE